MKRIRNVIAVVCPLMLRASVPVGSLAAIFAGLWMIYPPAAPLVVGLLVWFDLTIGSLRAGKDKA